MNIMENIKSAIFNIFSNKMRTILTTLGIIIGITSVTVITAIGTGFENQINENFAGINTESLTVATNRQEKITDKERFDTSDMELLKNLENVALVSPSYGTTTNIKLQGNNRNKNINLYSAYNDTQEMNKIKMKYGRFLTNKDSNTLSEFIVIDHNLAVEMFGRENVVGEKIEPDGLGMELEIVGVYEGKDEGFASNPAYIPFETLLDHSNTEKFDSFNITLKDTSLLNETSEEVVRVLASAKNTDKDKYDVTGGFAAVDSMQSSIQIFTMFIGVVAAISLLVGGIGIMNIMLVTVTERTREIGIRKSLGATNSDIQILFLIEAVTVSVLGGIIGIIFGYIGSFVAGKVLVLMGNDLVPAVSLGVILGAMIISTIIGVVFGVYPASKASKLDPIEALRFE